MTVPAVGAPDDEWDEWYADQECILRERLDLAHTMLRRIGLRGWCIAESNGEWWWINTRFHGTVPDDHPEMALTEPESRLWEALRKDRPQ